MSLADNVAAASSVVAAVAAVAAAWWARTAAGESAAVARERLEHDTRVRYPAERRAAAAPSFASASTAMDALGNDPAAQARREFAAQAREGLVVVELMLDGVGGSALDALLELLATGSDESVAAAQPVWADVRRRIQSWPEP